MRIAELADEIGGAARSKETIGLWKLIKSLR
jgi:hypothetical protein